MPYDNPLLSIMVLLISNIWQECRMRLWVSLGFFFPIFTLCFLCWPSTIPESNRHIQTEFCIFQETTFLLNCISHLSFLLFLFCRISVERPHHKKAGFTVFLYLSCLSIWVELIDKPASQLLNFMDGQVKEIENARVFSTFYHLSMV